MNSLLDIMFSVPSRIGRYTLHDEIASGGMATVHLGRLLGPAGFSRTVAVKRVHPHLAAGGELAAALLDEGRVSARIQHPFVVQTLDVVAAGGELAIILEYVHGVALSQLVRTALARGEAIDPHLAATILAQVLRGLHAAHEVTDEDDRPLELVHRDVSPQNILVSVEGIARVLDFGIAKVLGRASTTREGELKGKLAYMAPEQARALPIDRRTDVFASSVVLWELLTGARLFGGDDPKVSFGKVLRCEIARPSTLRASIDPALEAIVMRGLAADRADRHATAAEMAIALESWAPPLAAARIGAWVESLAGEVLAERRQRIAAMERGGAEDRPLAGDAPDLSTTPGDLTAGGTDTLSTPIVSADAPTRRRSPALVAIGALLGLAAVVGVLALRPHPPPPSASVPTAAPSSPPSVVEPVVSAAPPAPVGSVASSAPRPAAPPRTPAPVRRPAPAAASAQPDCTDPYVLDAQGKKRYRRECLTP